MKKKCKALHIDYKPFLGCLESFYDKFCKKKNKEENKIELKKKKKNWTI